MKTLLCVYGTGNGDFAFDGPCEEPTRHWYHSTSVWWVFMQTLGFAPFKAREFCWTGDINGLERWLPWNWFKRDSSRNDWYAGGASLIDYVGDRSVPDIILAHSHGGQVALYAAALGLKIPCLLTVATPVRADMVAIINRARPNIGKWVHVCASDFDHTAILGQLGDGSLSFGRAMPHADLNITIPGIDHSLLLTDQRQFEHWSRLILPKVFA